MSLVDVKAEMFNPFRGEEQHVSLLSQQDTKEVYQSPNRDSLVVGVQFRPWDMTMAFLFGSGRVRVLRCSRFLEQDYHVGYESIPVFSQPIVTDMGLTIKFGGYTVKSEQLVEKTAS